ncbi:conserved hypothetical protein [Neospora caninum Liverpool]|uniref:Uncharacterized protein n=1 Tax=Neospora caninum (strain Liverpool) TaxID=572307 RepID=F0VKD8_NEOCL|nr:conserved hypothetical protein [Neospora caninum Liverpool]CBZ54539.1 conserved hypothetical protein [Neospora caninum Liverpool]CEL69252.1 TPA: hypothetical protein BN1204_049680 [Neospora caninum Liverpool]|eukprot:XP_003884569.1 conserved hypothetical protein [Neospora caninum Liverpool]
MPDEPLDRPEAEARLDERPVSRRQSEDSSAGPDGDTVSPLSARGRGRCHSGGRRQKSSPRKRPVSCAFPSSSSPSSSPSLSSFPSSLVSASGAEASPHPLSPEPRRVRRSKQVGTSPSPLALENDAKSQLISPGERAGDAAAHEGGRRWPKRQKPSSSSAFAPLASGGPTALAAGKGRRSRSGRGAEPHGEEAGEGGGDTGGSAKDGETEETPADRARREKKVSRAPASASSARRRPASTPVCSSPGSFFEERELLDRTYHPRACDAPWYHARWPSGAPLPPCFSSSEKAKEAWEVFFAQWLSATFACRPGCEERGRSAGDGGLGPFAASESPFSDSGFLPLAARAGEHQDLAKERSRLECGECMREGAIRGRRLTPDAARVGATPSDIRSLFNCLLYGHPEGLFEQRGAGFGYARRKRRRTEDRAAEGGEGRWVSSVTCEPSWPAEVQKKLEGEHETKEDAEVDEGAQENADPQSLTPCRLFFSPAPPPPPAPRRRQPESLAVRNQRLYGARDGAELLQAYRHLAAAAEAGRTREAREDAPVDSSLRSSETNATGEPEGRQRSREERKRERSQEGPQKTAAEHQALAASLEAPQGKAEGRRDRGRNSSAAGEEPGGQEGKRETKQRLGDKGSSDSRRRWDMALQVLSKLKMGHSCEAIFLGLGDLSFVSRKKLFFRRHFDFRWTSKKKLAHAAGAVSGTPETSAGQPSAESLASGSTDGKGPGETPSGPLGSTGPQQNASAGVADATLKKSSGLEKQGRRGKGRKEEEKRAASSLPPAKRPKRAPGGGRGGEATESALWNVLADPDDSQSLFLTSWPSLSPHREDRDACVSGDSQISVERRGERADQAAEERDVGTAGDCGGMATQIGRQATAGPCSLPPRPYRPLCLLSLLQRSRAVRRARFLRYLLEQMEPSSPSLLHQLLLKGQLRVKCDHDSDRRVEFDRHVSWLLSRLPGDPQVLRYAWWGRGGSPGLQRGLQISQRRGDLALQWIAFPPLNSPPSLYPTSTGNAGLARSLSWGCAPTPAQTADRRVGLQTRDELRDSLGDASAVGAAVAAAAAGALNGSAPGARWGGGLLPGSTVDPRIRSASGALGDREGTETGKGGTGSGTSGAAALGSATAVGPFATGLQGGGAVLGASQRQLLSLFRRVCPADILYRGLATGSVSLSWPTATELQVLRLPELLLDQQVMRLGDAFVWSFEGWVSNLVAVAPFLCVYTPHRRTQIGIKKRLGVRQLPNALLTKGSPPPADFDEANHGAIGSRLPSTASSLSPPPAFPDAGGSSSARDHGAGPGRKRERKGREK